MEYLEGWELVLDHDHDHNGGGEKISSTNCLPSSSSSSLLEKLENSVGTEKKKNGEDDYEYPVSPEYMDLESAKASKDDEKDQETKEEQPQQPQRGKGKSGGFDIWKWRLTGIGALCSFGVATACVLVLGEAPIVKKNSHSHSHSHSHRACFNFKGYEQNQRLVEAVRGGSLHVPFTAAHITFGGYIYDAHLSTSTP